jgi:hypothetical protein
MELYLNERMLCNPKNIKIIFFSFRSFVFLAVTVLPFLPATNLLFRVGFVIAERNLYLSSLGVAGLVALGFQRLKQRFRRKWYVKNA